MNMIETLEAEQIAALGKDIPDFAAGDTLRVGYKVTEGTRPKAHVHVSRTTKAYASVAMAAVASELPLRSARFPLAKV